MTAPDLGAKRLPYCSDRLARRAPAPFRKIPTTALAFPLCSLYTCIEYRRTSQETDTMSQTLTMSGAELQSRRMTEALSQAVAGLRRIVLIRDGELVRRPRPRQARLGLLPLRVTG